MMRTWTCKGFDPVQAHTKGEARALFLAQARHFESLTFHPQKIERLPAGTKVVAAAQDAKVAETS